jgi:sterol desaturase/sphingolipid hydroxylase (fatty acid hydroxylase superfamily)
MNEYTWIVAGIFTGFSLLEMALGRFLHREATSPKDVFLEVIAGLTIPLVIIPMTMVLGAHLVECVYPNSGSAWAHWPIWSMVLILIFADDLTQYWWHRLSHGLPWLYALHRAHHSGRYMSVRVVYRNSLIYYALMPGLWFSAALIHLGFGYAYAGYIIVKMAVIIAAHSSVPWDEPLLRNRLTRPLMWGVSRVISTPRTHAAHHGRHQDDGVTHYKGNFGNLLFLWDIIFRTAKMPSERPESYGLENVEPASCFQELIWPMGQGTAQYVKAQSIHKERI